MENSTQMTSIEAAAVLESIATSLELADDLPERVCGYRQAARLLLTHKAGARLSLDGATGIGPTLRRKIETIANAMEGRDGGQPE